MINKKFLNFLLQLLINNILRILSPFVKKRHIYWLFSMDGGRDINGNVLYLLNYICDNHKEIKPVCFINNKKKSKLLQDKGIIVCKTNSFGSLFYATISKVCICSYEMAVDHVNFSTKNNLKINLWHGGGIKKIQYLDKKINLSVKKKSLKVKIKNILINYVRHEDYDFIGYKAHIFKDIMQKAFNNKNLFLNGNPRDDFFYKKTHKIDILKKYNLEKFKEKKIISYLPTFRENSENDVQTLFKKKENINKLIKNNIFIIHKLHPYRNNNQFSDISSIYQSNYIETQELLKITDILITDYSGSYFDFLHQKKPIIFYPYDYQDYIENERELWLDDYFSDKNTPGPKCKNEDELINNIEKYLNDPLKDLEMRMNALDKFQAFKDGNNCKRTFDLINSVLKQHN